MRFSYQLDRLCGTVYTQGNVAFSPDGASVLSPVGNRLSVFDLVNHTSKTLAIESRKSIKRIAVSNDGRFVVTVDRDGHALFMNLKRQVLLQRIHFKRKVHAIKFSPDDKYFAITHGRGVQIWRTPSVLREFSPLTLHRTLAGHHDDTSCVDWSADSRSIVMGSVDLTARVYERIHSKWMSLTVLSGHRGQLVGAFFSDDGQSIYTVAEDGAIFTWEYVRNKPTEAQVEQNNSEEEENSDENEDEDSDSDSDDGHDDVSSKKKRGRTDSTIRQRLAPARRKRGEWVLKAREFLWENRVEVSSAAFNKPNSLLVVGFTNGVFGLYEMPGCTNIHRLSVSHNSIRTVDINPTGEWLVMASRKLGQLLVWEWKSETYVMKQQGHIYGLNTLEFSPDGHTIATGGDDHKIKLWSSSSGFCFVTFSEHTAPVTGIAFAGKGNGKAVISSSLDGTVRAHDLIRYKNFRTMTSPTPVQFTCVAVDSSGDIVCAGAMEPFSIYVWALQTGRLLDVLAGHEGPISSLDFSNGQALLASGSWDGTLKLWDVYKNTCVETFEHGTDVMAVAFRPDGKEVCCAVLNGNLYFYDVEEGKVTYTIEGRRDIAGGRLSTDAMTADNSTRSKYFTSIAYTPDGSCIIAGGRSKYICIYAVRQQLLVKKFQISHNQSLEGVMDELRNTNLTEGGSLNALDVTDSEGEGLPQSHMPGARRGADGSRITKPEVRSTCVRFSSTGREWAAATPEGLLVYALDTATLFDPTDIDEAITPQTIRAVAARGDHTKAVNMALHLGEGNIIKEVVDQVEPRNISLVVQGLASQMMKTFFRFLADQVNSSRHLEYYLQWCRHSLMVHAKTMMTDSLPYMESIRTLIRAITNHEKDMMRMCDDNQYVLDYLGSLPAPQPELVEEPELQPEHDTTKPVEQDDSISDEAAVEELAAMKGKKSRSQRKSAKAEPEPAAEKSKKKRKKSKATADDR